MLPAAVRALPRRKRAVAVTPDGRTLYVANWGRVGLWRRNGDTVTPVTLSTGTPGAPIRVGNEPQALLVTPEGRTLYVAAHDGTVTPVT